MSAAPKPAPPAARDPDLDKDIHQLIGEVVPYFVGDVDGWLHTPQPRFNMATPAEVIGTPLEAKLRDRLRAAKQGAFS